MIVTMVRSSRLTADILTVLSDRIVKAFKRLGAIQAGTLDKTEDFDWVYNVGLPKNTKRSKFQIALLALIFYFSLMDNFV